MVIENRKNYVSFPGRTQIVRLRTRGRVIRLDELEQTFVLLFVSSVRTGTRHIIRLDKLSSVVRLQRRILWLKG